jgi:hypothetical protein
MKVYLATTLENEANEMLFSCSEGRRKEREECSVLYRRIMD